MTELMKTEVVEELVEEDLQVREMEPRTEDKNASIEKVYENEGDD